MRMHCRPADLLTHIHAGRTGGLPGSIILPSPSPRGPFVECSFPSPRGRCVECSFCSPCGRFVECFIPSPRRRFVDCSFPLPAGCLWSVHCECICVSRLLTLPSHGGRVTGDLPLLPLCPPLGGRWFSAGRKATWRKGRERVGFLLLEAAAGAFESLGLG